MAILYFMINIIYKKKKNVFIRHIIYMYIYYCVQNFEFYILS